MALTRRQREVFDFIQDFIGRHGYSPSLQEIASALGLSSVATVHKHVTHLVAKGLVRRGWNQNRSIEVAAGAGASGVRFVPVIATFVPGKPIEASAESGAIAVPEELLAGRGRAFALRVRGKAAIEEQLRDGDCLIVEERSVARDGETVVASVEGRGAWIGRLRREGADVRLESSRRGEVEPSSGPAGLVRVEGVVVGMIRTY